jgi:hypothetical protein
VRVSARALPSIDDLDAVAFVRVAAGGSELYAGPLGGLRTVAGAGRLAPGQEATLDVRVALAESAGERSAGRVLDIVLELAATPEVSRSTPPVVEGMAPVPQPLGRRAPGRRGGHMSPAAALVGIAWCLCGLVCGLIGAVTVPPPAGMSALTVLSARSHRRRRRPPGRRAPPPPQGERWSVAADGEVGRVVYRVPRAGALLAWSRTPAGRLLVVVLPLALITGLALRRIWRRPVAGAHG